MRILWGKLVDTMWGNPGSGYYDRGDPGFRKKTERYERRGLKSTAYKSRGGGRNRV